MIKIVPASTYRVPMAEFFVRRELSDWLSVGALLISGLVALYTVRQNWGKPQRDAAAFKLSLMPYIAGLQAHSVWKQRADGFGDLVVMFHNIGGGPAFVNEKPTLRFQMRGSGSDEEISKEGSFDNPVVPPGVWVAATFDKVPALSSNREAQYFVEGSFEDILGGVTEFTLDIDEIQSGNEPGRQVHLSHLHLNSSTLKEVKASLA